MKLYILRKKTNKNKKGNRKAVEKLDLRVLPAVPIADIKNSLLRVLFLI